MQIQTSELQGAALDWAVAKCKGLEPHIEPDFDGTHILVGSQIPYDYFPSTNWSQGGPIIEREGITTAFCSGDLGEPRTYWIATIEQQSWDYGYGPYHEQDEDKSLCISKPNVTKGTTPLIAAMRCYVASKLGDTVEIPEELK
jgi:hypothetical protein